MSGISGSGSGRHVASHAKPGAMTHAKGKVKTAAAVTSVLAVSGGVATAFHMHQDGLRNSAEAASSGDANNSAAIAAANALAARSSTAANRDLARPGLTQSSSAAPSTSQAPTSAATSSTTPPAPTSTSTTSTTPPAPTTTKSPIPLPTKTSTSTPTPPKTTTTTPTSSSSSGSGTNMGYNATPAQAKAMAEQIVPSSQFLCFSNIIERESSWDVHATNPSSGAYGLGQALPGYKMASMGSEWRNSALVQIKWALSYMTGRYGSPCAAWAFWQAHDWY
ncbi:hypothetical protein ABH935_000922 [Catenulispora sp. GAS73]|uniref:aggregation-promoting factor C-terminal-like domain-containing protein n=1 Tax=Catenulispora sp. GAS73 TaxID=3156269 RepID=UPI00351146F6